MPNRPAGRVDRIRLTASICHTTRFGRGNIAFSRQLANSPWAGGSGPTGGGINIAGSSRRITADAPNLVPGGTIHAAIQLPHRPETRPERPASNDGSESEVPRYFVSQSSRLKTPSTV